MSGEGYNDDDRRRRVDELFADEPFLSPTMRARRLHELQPGTHPASSEIKNGGGPSASSDWLRLDKVEESSPPGRMRNVSMSEARNWFRARRIHGIRREDDKELSDQLTGFKARLLDKWTRDSSSEL